ncbi:Nuclear receptor subfamily 1 group I member 3 [Bienertia sinuspersici]
MFRNMVKCAQEMMSNCGSRIGNGENTSILAEVWAGKRLLKFKRNPTLEQEEAPKVECVFCGKEETASHLFLYCEVAKRIWKSSVLGIIPPTCPFANVSTWFQNMFLYLFREGNGTYQAWPYLVSTIWAIWIHRNSAIFKHQKINPQEVLTLSNIELARWQKGFEYSENSGDEKQSLNMERVQLSWEWGTTNQHDNILLVDGAWKKVGDEASKAAYGWVMEQGRARLRQGAGRIFASSPLQAEAHAILVGASIAIKEWSMVNIYTDSAKMIQMIHAPRSAPADCYHLILDLINVLKSFFFL